MSINLIPPQIKKKYRIERKLNIIFSWIRLFLIIVIIASGLLFGVSQSAQRTISGLDSTIATLKSEIEQYQATENQIKQINSKLQKIEKVDKDRIIWSTTLKELSNCTPKEVALKDLTLSQNGLAINFNGEAETRREIARYKEKLESSTYFKNVFFSSSSLNQDKNNYTFSMSAELEKTK